MAKETEIKNAIISSVSLDTGDRGLLTGWLNLDYGGSGQGFGGHCLYLPKSFTHHTEKGDYNFQTENWIYQACGSYPTHWLKKATTPIVEGYSREQLGDFGKWLEYKEYPYEEGNFVVYENGKDNYYGTAEMFSRYLSSLPQSTSITK